MRGHSPVRKSLHTKLATRLKKVWLIQYQPIVLGCVMCSATQPTRRALPDQATQSVGRRRALTIPGTDSKLSAERQNDRWVVTAMMCINLPSFWCLPPRLSDEVSSRSTVPSLDHNSSLQQRNPHDTMESKGNEMTAFATSPPESPGTCRLTLISKRGSYVLLQLSSP